MLKPLKYAFLIFFIFTVGCTDITRYNDDDIAAIVKGEEITIGELRFLYPDENVLERIEGTVKAELVIKEAKQMNLDVSEEIKETVELRGELPPKDVDASEVNPIREIR